MVHHHEVGKPQPAPGLTTLEPVSWHKLERHTCKFVVDLIEGQRLPYWNDRVTVYEEPITFTGDAPTPSGSFVFRDWHLISSRTYGLRPPANDPAKADEYAKSFPISNL